VRDYLRDAKTFVRESGYTPDHPQWFEMVRLARWWLMHLDCLPQTTELDRR
jgi:hypothetical protein